MNVVISLIALSCVFFSGVTLAAYDSARLDTLFTDKVQRAQIDASRSGRTTDKAAPQINKVRIDGYVTRSDGKNVVWLNNQNTLKSTKVNNIKVHPSSIKNNKVTISVDGKSARLKPGETWNKESGEIVDNR
jgi:hypothetical protein